jgi:hypothetical protein
MKENTFPTQTGNTRFTMSVLVMAGLLVCLTAINTQSYWIDEAGTAYKAMQSTLPDWWHAMRAEGNSNLQLPAYLLFAWGWEKLVGLDEFALRAGNGLWFLPGLVVMALALKRTSLWCWGVSLALLFSPFAWYYLNEARPYAMQIGASCIVFAALYQLGQIQNTGLFGERGWVIVFCMGSLLLAASGMLAMLWLGAFWGGAILSTTKNHLRELARAYLGWWLLTCGLLFAFGLYYLWTMSIGARATTAGTTDVKNILFVFYELLGFTGLGPGRLEIRYGGFAVFRQWLPWLVIYGMASTVLLGRGCQQIVMNFSRRTVTSWLIAFVLVFGFILAVGFKVQFRVLGRHCTPVLPLVLFVQGLGLASCLGSGKWIWRLLALLFLGGCLVSDANVRFAERHAKDDYRGAAALARQALARGDSVWWSADVQGAEVYHLPVRRITGATNVALVVINSNEKFIKGLPRPDLVLASKPDLYDSSGALENYLVNSGFHRTAALSAFTAWQPARNSIRPPAAATR